MKVPRDVAPAALFRLLRAEWHLPAPNLVVSLVGTERPLALRARLQDVLRKGLVTAAQSTGGAPRPHARRPPLSAGAWDEGGHGSRGAAEGPRGPPSPGPPPGWLGRGLARPLPGPRGLSRTPLGTEAVPTPAAPGAPPAPAASLTGPLRPAGCRGQKQAPGPTESPAQGGVLALSARRCLRQRGGRPEPVGWGPCPSGNPPAQCRACPPPHPAPPGWPTPRAQRAPPAGAWILTSALRTGLARHVGQAVLDHSLASTSTRARVVAVGIASLGRVLHRQLLDGAPVSPGAGEGPQPPSVARPRVEGKPPVGPAGWQRPTARCLSLSGHSPSPPHTPGTPTAAHRPDPALGLVGGEREAGAPKEVGEHRAPGGRPAGGHTDLGGSWAAGTLLGAGPKHLPGLWARGFWPRLRVRLRQGQGTPSGPRKRSPPQPRVLSGGPRGGVGLGGSLAPASWRVRGQERRPVHYPTDDSGGQGPLCPLDSNQSHFVLVEPDAPGDGDGPTELWLRLEKHISEQRTGYGGEAPGSLPGARGCLNAEARDLWGPGGEGAPS